MHVHHHLFIPIYLYCGLQLSVLGRVAPSVDSKPKQLSSRFLPYHEVSEFRSASVKCSEHLLKKVKVEFSLEQAMKAQRVVEV
jgi:hypothetical protein